ncbi:Abi family protein [Thiomicrorhabdus aquaedulcis]|uniref:Abi family protein n=1 Tax=Thiomicrorhabdus aquaedulcis TaxID=2211106 RepID=UPI000FDA8515|nr:Abi family protein [Thiomicrorhabdus aquaedulcis]
MTDPTKIYQKPPKTTEQHIQQLASRGLCFNRSGKERALRYLSHIGYYRLSAYFIPFEESSQDNKRTHLFKSGTEFNHVLDLYIFDRKLRILVMEAIERIEVSIRANWSNALTLNKQSPHKQDAHAYMNPSLFKNPWQHQKNLSRVASDIADSEDQSVKHYKQTYLEPFLPPTWIMVETLTFGSLSQWFANTKSTAVKKAVTKAIGLPTIEITESVLQSLSLVRNICAHHGRLWNRQLVKQLPYIRKLKQYMVIEQIRTEKSEVQHQPSRKLFNFLVVINHLMNNIQPKTSWSQRLDELMATLPQSHHHELGIPQSWKGFVKQTAQLNTQN